MILHLSIETEGQHATDDPAGLAGSCLATAAKAIESGATEGWLRDDNGNTVGAWSLAGVEA